MYNYAKKYYPEKIVKGSLEKNIAGATALYDPETK
jgi:hypothetical protein